MEAANSIENKYFPDLRTHDFPRWIEVEGAHFDARDIVCFGTPMTVETLTEAYHKGIFPWDVSPYVPLPWYCPARRAILEFADLKIPRSLRREWKKTPFTFSIDRNFLGVIRTCRGVDRKGQRGPSWITPTFVRGFYELHQAGMAHSVEVWEGEETGKLVGGLYGVDCGGVFCGESMFHFRSNASKFAVLFLIEHLKERGAAWLDIEVMTPHFEMLGAKEIDRAEFLDKLESTQAMGLKIF
jgi:leucyl/phenylalanyl-tRNA--protein transferase